MDLSKRFLGDDAFCVAERFAELDEVVLLAEGVLVYDEDDALLEDLTWRSRSYVPPFF